VKLFYRIVSYSIENANTRTVHMVLCSVLRPCQHSIGYMGGVCTELCTSFWRTSRTVHTWPTKNLFHNSLFSLKRGSTTSILSQNNKACNGTNKSVKTVISVHCVTPFFHVVCKQPTTAKMYKIFIVQKSYCACRVLSLAAIRRSVPHTQ